MPNFVEKKRKTIRERDKVICTLTDGTKEKGVLLYHRGCGEYTICFTSSQYMANEYDYNSYEKGYPVKELKPEDLELVESYLERR